MTDPQLLRLMVGPTLPEIFACFGQPVIGNPTQYMIEKAFQAAGYAGRYITLEVAPGNLGSAIQGMRAMGIRGANFTLPHKINVIPHLDQLSESARLIGAVNCVLNDNGHLTGENTDGKGFLKSLNELVDPRGKNVVLLGAGGACRAVSVELALAGAAKLTIVNRTVERGQALAAHLAANTPASAKFVPWSGEYAVSGDADILINCTSLGLNQPTQRVPVSWDAAPASLVVADVVFNPPQTAFLREAASRGLRTLDGLGMLVNQGVIGIHLWTGIDPDPAVMMQALVEAFQVSG